MYNFWHSLSKPIIALAPMEGVSDSPFRSLCKEWGADVVYTEFLPADAIALGIPKILAKMKFNEAERPIVCQIFGRNPESFTIAAKKVEAMGFDGLDINFGCPARKVVGHGSGVALLRDPLYARRLIEAALANITIPISIKVRTSIRKESKEVDPGCADRYTALDFLTAMKDLPISAVMVHGRSYEQGHQGEVDAAMIKQVKELFGGIVLANGGIFSPERAKEMLTETSADGVGIARGALGQPWIFKQTKELLARGLYKPAAAMDMRRAIDFHAKLLFAAKGPHGLLEFRKHLIRYLKGKPNAADLRRQAGQITTIEDIDLVLASAVA